MKSNRDEDFRVMFYIKELIQIFEDNSEYFPKKFLEYKYNIRKNIFDMSLNCYKANATVIKTKRIEYIDLASAHFSMVAFLLSFVQENKLIDKKSLNKINKRIDMLGSIFGAWRKWNENYKGKYINKREHL